MPILFEGKSNRRQFIRTTVLGAASLSVLSNRAAFGENTDTARWAFLSDVHVPRDPSNVYRGFYPYENMKKAAAEIVAAKPEGAVITGDLARLEGFTGDYAALKATADPLLRNMPVCMALGNHDDRGNFLNAFKKNPGKQKVNGKHVSVIDTGPVRFIVLDSLMFSNKTPGLIGKTQRDWLRSFLRTSGSKPTFLFYHHSMRESDGDLLDVDRLFSIIVPANQVKAIIYGHSHVYDFEERLGIQLINLPAVAYNFNDRDPIGWVEAELDAQGGAFTLHTIGGNQTDNGKTTRIKWRG